jgi:hypothetical protein
MRVLLLIIPTISILMEGPSILNQNQSTNLHTMRVLLIKGIPKNIPTGPEIARIEVMVHQGALLNGNEPL